MPVESRSSNAVVRRHEQKLSREVQLPEERKLKSRNHLLLGLTIAGVASSILTTIFGLFHVDVFLRVYKLPLSSYTNGNLIFSVVNTLNDLAGAWVVDHASATTISRHDMVGVAGCLFAFCFLTPFFRWNTDGDESWQNSFHFVISMSLYDTLHSFISILTGSIVTDDHTMTDKQRVRFMASGKFTNMLVSFIFARIGLALFNVDSNLVEFRMFLIALACLSALLFFIGQSLISGISFPFCKWLRRRRSGPRHEKSKLLREDKLEHGYDSNENTVNYETRQLQWNKVFADFRKHSNFRSWVLMEMFLEGQNTFSFFFLKTFVDHLVLHQGYSRNTCDWILSLAGPMSSAITLLCYIPINKFGYHRVYSLLFITNFIFASSMLFSGPESPTFIAIFLMIYPAITKAVQSSGFHLAMADMVLEMKRMHMLEGRVAEPSLAGLFMGTNALFCKPMESVLPMIAATVMERTSSNRQSLFYLLVLPPIVCSTVQLKAWSRYNLTPKRTSAMRSELLSFKREQQHNPPI